MTVDFIRDHQPIKMAAKAAAVVIGYVNFRLFHINIELKSSEQTSQQIFWQATIAVKC